MTTPEGCELCGEALDAPIIWRDGAARPCDDILVDPHTLARAHDVCFQAVGEPSIYAVVWLLWRLRGGPDSGETLGIGAYA